MTQTQLSDVDPRAAVRRDLDELEARELEILARIDRASRPELRSVKPNPEEWSLTEVVQHLALVSQAMLKAAHPRSEAAPLAPNPKVAEMTAALRSDRKMKTPSDRIVPRPGVTWNDAIDNARLGIKQWRDFVASDEFEETSFTHPFAGELSAGETVAFLIEHLEHHIPQVERLLARQGQ